MSSRVMSLFWGQKETELLQKGCVGFAASEGACGQPGMCSTAGSGVGKPLEQQCRAFISLTGFLCG